MKKIICKNLPRKAASNVVYRLIPKNFSREFYDERTNRNLGWITKTEQEILRNAKISIVGCGGMGGRIAEYLLRTGIGELRISDDGFFDRSNIQRQAGATLKTIGKSKGIETGRFLRNITDDTVIEVYSQGLNEETAMMMVEGCDIVCDEIELFEIAARILLHKTVREANGTIFTCPTVGHEVYLTKFTSQSMTIEEVLGIEYEEVKLLQAQIKADPEARKKFSVVVDRMIRFVAPEIPEYSINTGVYSTVTEVLHILATGRAPIIGTNPGSAAGFMANQILFQLLELKSPLKRNFITPSPMPSYLKRDDARPSKFNGIWW